MASRIIVFHTLPDNELLAGLFSAWRENGTEIFFIAPNPQLRKKCQEKNWPLIKWPWFCPGGWGWQIIYFALAPLWPPLCFLCLWRLKTAKKITAVLCLSWPEKIIITPLAARLGLKNIWLECPPPAYIKWPKWRKACYRRQARRATIVALSGLIKNELAAAGLADKNVLTVMPGIKPQNSLRQENIFANLAQAEPGRQNRKYFTVGTAASLKAAPPNLEILFRAAKDALAVIPSLQLIVMGEGPEKKSLEWLAKKLGIAEIVWFVGEPPILGKWLANLDVFAVTAKPLELEDIRASLYAGAHGLPIIGPAGIGLEDLVLPNQNGLLVESDRSEALAQAIIELYQNRRLRLRYGQNSKDLVDKHFRLDQTAGQLLKIIVNA